ncbi:MAG: hypothetical protein CMF98_06840 [Candidatus Marinimicrobia bacterium]|nr:hypothetical protein [Candidatus Neomarinimicrobiota bacterium]OUW49828.1 MAG: hypothetical protein CBD50_04640 [bacterium TMED190]
MLYRFISSLIYYALIIYILIFVIKLQKFEHLLLGMFIAGFLRIIFFIWIRKSNFLFFNWRNNINKKK